MAFVVEGQGIARAGQPGGGRRRGHQRHPLAVPARGCRHGLRARAGGPPTARGCRSTSVARCALPSSGPSRSTERVETPMAEASYPDELLYHAEHDWARIDEAQGQATLGITWYAQDALGEVVFFDPPAVGSTLAKDSSYAEVESVKAVSDVIAPLSGRDRRGQRGPGREPRADQRGPLRRGLAGEGADVGPLRARGAARRRLLPLQPGGLGWSRELEPLHRHHTFGSRRDAGRDRRRLRSRSCSSARSRPPCACASRWTCPPGCPSRRSSSTCGRWPSATAASSSRSASSAPGCMTTTCRRWSTCSPSARSS